MATTDFVQNDTEDGIECTDVPVDDIPAVDSNGSNGQDASMNPPSAQVPCNNQLKKPHRRKPSKKKRKWKPYSKMTWEERKVLDEKEKCKAFRIREEMKEKGRPVAPYNTTQFLMEEHDPFDSDTFDSEYNNPNAQTTGTDESNSDEQEVGYNGEGGMNGNGEALDATPSLCDGSMEAYTDSPHMEPEFISQDFSETYERVHEENLQTMTRDELMEEHIDLERKLSVLQDQLASSKRSQEKKMKVLETVIENLESQNQIMKSENTRLVMENEVLKLKSGNILSRMSTSDYNVDDPDDGILENVGSLRDGEIMERR